jgi:hypothetical protein
LSQSSRDAVQHMISRFVSEPDSKNAPDVAPLVGYNQPLKYCPRNRSWHLPNATDGPHMRVLYAELGAGAARAAHEASAH